MTRRESGQPTSIADTGRSINLYFGHEGVNQPPFWTHGGPPTSSADILRGGRQATFFFRRRGSAWGSRTAGWSMGGGGYPRKWRILSLDSMVCTWATIKKVNSFRVNKSKERVLYMQMSASWWGHVIGKCECGSVMCHKLVM